MAYGVEHRGSTVRVSGENVPMSLFAAGILVTVLGIAGFWVLAQNQVEGAVEVVDVRSRFRSFAEAMADGDGEAACGMMRSDIAQAFADRAAIQLDVAPGSCDEMVAGFAAARSTDASRVLREVEIIDARVVDQGEEFLDVHTQAEVDIDEGTMSFERAEDCDGGSECWLVFDGGPVFRMADPTREGG